MEIGKTLTSKASRRSPYGGVHVLDLYFIHWIVPFPLEGTFCGDAVPTELHTSTAVLLHAGCE